MAIENFEKNMAIVSSLDDEPNDVGGLSAAELKAKFDEGGEALKAYINNTLIPGIVREVSAASVASILDGSIQQKKLEEAVSLAIDRAKADGEIDKNLAAAVAALTEALSEKVSKSSDTMTGNLTIDIGSGVQVKVKRTGAAREGEVEFNGSTLWLSNAKDGSNYSSIRLRDEAASETTMLELVSFVNGVSKTRSIFHEGNKPTGTYTGNGESGRSIDIGTSSAHVVLVRAGDAGGNVMAIVTMSGCIYKNGSNVIGDTALALSGGKLLAATTGVAAVFNKTGVAYYYDVLY